MYTKGVGQECSYIDLMYAEINIRMYVIARTESAMP